MYFLLESAHILVINLDRIQIYLFTFIHWEHPTLVRLQHIITAVFLMEDAWVSKWGLLWVDGNVLMVILLNTWPPDRLFNFLVILIILQNGIKNASPSLSTIIINPLQLFLINNLTGKLKYIFQAIFGENLSSALNNIFEKW